MSVFQCLEAVLAERLARQKEYQKRWEDQHPGYRREYQRRWRKLHPDLDRASKRRWSKKNPEKVRRWARIQREKWINRNPDKYADIVAEHIEAVERGVRLSQLEDFWFRWPHGARVTIAHDAPLYKKDPYPVAARSGSCVDPDCICKSGRGEELWRRLGDLEKLETEASMVQGRIKTLRRKADQMTAKRERRNRERVRKASLIDWGMYGPPRWTS